MENEGQDILRCNVCDEPEHPFHCDICQVNLCRGCVGDHLLDLNRRHQIVPFKERGGLIYSICQIHSLMQCQLYCESSDTALCAQFFLRVNIKITKNRCKGFLKGKNWYTEWFARIWNNDFHQISRYCKRYFGSKRSTESIFGEFGKRSRKIRTLAQNNASIFFFRKLKSETVEIHNKHSFVLTKEQFETVGVCL